MKPLHKSMKGGMFENHIKLKPIDFGKEGKTMPHAQQTIWIRKVSEHDKTYEGEEQSGIFQGFVKLPDKDIIDGILVVDNGQFLTYLNNKIHHIWFDEKEAKRYKSNLNRRKM